jgi:hypothetical protein
MFTLFYIREQFTKSISDNKKDTLLTVCHFYWQGAEYENQTFDDEVNFELYELDFIYEANEEKNKDV